MSRAIVDNYPNGELNRLVTTDVSLQRQIDALQASIDELIAILDTGIDQEIVIAGVATLTFTNGVLTAVT